MTSPMTLADLLELLTVERFAPLPTPTPRAARAAGAARAPLTTEQELQRALFAARRHGDVPGDGARRLQELAAAVEEHGNPGRAYARARRLSRARRKSA